MPEQPQKPQAPPQKQVAPQKQQAPTGKGKAPSPEQSPAPEKAAPKKKTPAETKDDRFKYEMTYANGGYNNGAEVKPDKNGKANIEISIYGGGQKKSLSVGPLPPNIEKLVKAYELSANQNEDSPEITQELQKYFAQAKTLLNAKVLEIFKQADLQIANAIKETFNQVNQDHSKS
tara:strand:+ start:1699 stop:2223 length:525 start_codon:yes stop_codon:yes gene_type:complete